jgi:hypothetical protein
MRRCAPENLRFAGISSALGQGLQSAGAAWGTRGPEFKSRRPDMRKVPLVRDFRCAGCDPFSVGAAHWLPKPRSSTSVERMDAFDAAAG